MAGSDDDHQPNVANDVGDKDASVENNVDVTLKETGRRPSSTALNRCGRICPSCVG